MAEEEREIPVPDSDEDESEFIGRCMNELLENGESPAAARRQCSISWKAYGENPPPKSLASAHFTQREVFNVAPPPIRNIPEQLSELFDRALKLGQSGIEEDFLEAVAELSKIWTLTDLEAELRKTGTLNSILDGADGADAFALFRSGLRDSWDGSRDSSGRRLEPHKAPVVNTYVSASDAVSVTSPVRESWWTSSRWFQQATDYANSVSAQRVTLISESTRAGIRSIVSESFKAGKDRDWISRALVALEGDGSLNLGLDSQRAKILARFSAQMDPDIPASRQAKLIGRRYRQLLKDRANSIAQTEVVTVANEAQVATYQAAVQEGELDDSRYVMEWVTRAIGCPRCRAMDGATREISAGEFISDGSGPKGVEKAAMPDLHPRGWCFTRIVRRSEARMVPTL